MLDIRGLAIFCLRFLWKRWGILSGKFPLAPVCYNGVMAYIRKFKTTSGATGVQVCYKEGNKVVKTVHVGSAASAPAVEKLIKKAQGIIDSEKNPLFNLSKFDKK